MEQDREDALAAARQALEAEREGLAAARQTVERERWGLSDEIARAAGIDMRRYYRVGVQTYMCILNNCRNVHLRDISIVDTPGTNSIERMEEEITRGFVPRADLVLFVTSLLQPLTASEIRSAPRRTGSDGPGENLDRFPLPDQVVLLLLPEAVGKRRPAMVSRWISTTVGRTSPSGFARTRGN